MYLMWEGVPDLAPDEYYVVRIPYDDMGGVAEFWRKDTWMQVPSHYSQGEYGFPDRHYNWSVQVMRCTAHCDQVANDAVRKQGVEVGSKSVDRVFYWHPDVSGPGPGPSGRPPTPTPS